MPELDLSVDGTQAVAALMRFLAVEGITGQEQAIAEEVRRALLEAGVAAEQVRFDRAHEKIPLPTQTGNLIVTLPGTRPGARRLFLTHLDTVPLAAGARPVQRDGRISPTGNTALGGDNRTGVACLVTLAATLLRRRLPHPPLTLLFTVREESGLWGARFVDAADLGNSVEGYNVDGANPAELTVGAVGAERWDVEITGRASHAGVHPEQGVSATMVAALALAEVFEGGWFGKVRKDGREGTSNLGTFGGRDGGSAGNATNVVTDYVLIHGESRSHDPSFFQAITQAYEDAFTRAARRVVDHEGRGAAVAFQSRLDYHPFRLADDTPVVQRARAAAQRAGLQPELRVGNGGLDANWLVRHGIPTVTFGAGQRQIHTTQEYVEVQDFLAGCRLALALATQDVV
jgi:tripeptide aminopeptidase